MASSSNTPDEDALARRQNREYLYISNTNVSNFVSVKLSGYRNYHLWKKQMICLMEAHDMCGLVDDGFLMKKYDSLLVKKYDSLLKGWIFGSVSEDILNIIVDDDSAKDVWKKLESYFDSTMTSKQDSALTKADTETNTEDKSVKKKPKNKNVDLGETTTIDTGMNSAISEAKSKEAIHIEIKDSAPSKIIETDAGTAVSDKKLQKLIADENWDSVYRELKEKKSLTLQLNSYGNTLLHITVGLSQNSLSKEILPHISNDELTEMKNLDGSTVLHIAAIVGNRKAAEFLVEKNKTLLHTLDKKGQTPLYTAYDNMHLDTIAFLLEEAENQEKATKEVSQAPKRKAIAYVDETGKPKSSLLPPVEIGVDVLVNAITAKEYELASKLIRCNPQYVVSKNNVLMAMARAFPSGLDYGERLIYPSWKYMWKWIVVQNQDFLSLSLAIGSKLGEAMLTILCCCILGFRDFCLFWVFIIIFVPMGIVMWVFVLIIYLLTMAFYPFFMIYFLLWNGAAIAVPHIKNINNKMKEYKKAKEILKLVLKTTMEKCTESRPDLYTEPILEAARQDAYEVVIQILGSWPDAIRCKDKNGYDIIQLATIHRSERIYNIIYFLGERKSIYRTMEDSSKNNMLHLAGRLAPSYKLKRRTGAALQLQRELQWRQEVEKLVFPSYVTKENILMETPEMIFTKEHENLVKEGEQWIKTVAESCSITSALITTIVFAAAITVPGGNDQETGFPELLKNPAFIIFSIANAISLFSSVTALLVFLSILTARFAEEDFLIRLPRRLIIGLCTLLLSTTAMMIAFGATLFLVFSHGKLWVLAPTCGLGLLPIAFFLILQLPLILDLFRSTYISKFGGNRNKSSRVILKDMRLYFSK